MQVCVCVLHVLMHHKHFHLNNFHQRSGKLLATKWAVPVQAGASLYVCVYACVCIGVNQNNNKIGKVKGKKLN